MKILSSWLRKQTAVCLVILLAAPLADAAPPPQQQASNSQQSQAVTTTQNRPETLDSKAVKPEADTSPAEPVYPDNPAPVPPQAPSQSAQSGSDQQQNPAPKPVGTAAAPYEKTTGVAASRPAGAVIAPAKQKRARAILISMGIVLGGAVAVGTVVALSKGSPSKPN
jgi:hypothetical protein